MSMEKSKYALTTRPPSPRAATEQDAGYNSGLRPFQCLQSIIDRDCRQIHLRQDQIQQRL